MVTWTWKNKMGTMYYNDKAHNSKWKVNIYKGNCLGVALYEYKEKDSETGELKNYYRLSDFWLDFTHLKRNLGLSTERDYKDNSNIYIDNCISKIKLNVFFKDCIKIAELFAKSGVKVELYYKEVKSE